MLNRIRVMAGIAVAVGALSLMPALAHAQQDDPSQKQIESLELNEADVRDALKALFKMVGVSFVIDQSVQGQVTVNLKKVTFETALRNILNQVKATYRVEGGVYQIVPREENLGNPQGPADLGTGPENQRKGPPVRIKIRNADPHFIMQMLQGGFGPTQVLPEYSTIILTQQFGGGRGGFGGGGQGGFGGGQGGFGGGQGGFGGGQGGFGGGSGGFGGGGFGGGSGGIGGGGGFGGGGFGGGRGGR